MRALFEHLFGSLFHRLFPEGEFVFGWLLAFALWCLDYAVVEAARRRLGHAVPLAAAAAGLVTLVLLPDWEARSLWRIGLCGLIFYLPLFVHSRRPRHGPAVVQRTRGARRRHSR